MMTGSAGNELVTMFAGLLGTVIIPFVVYYGQQRAARTHATADLLREFNATEMSHTRRNAQRLVPNSPTLSEAEKEYFYEIARFYHRLNAMRKAGILRNDLLFDFFAQDFAFWWKYSLECLDQAARTQKDSWELKEFFKQAAIAKTAKNEWEGWLKKGERNHVPPLSPLPNIGLTPSSPNAW